MVLSQTYAGHGEPSHGAVSTGCHRALSPAARCRGRLSLAGVAQTGFPKSTRGWGHASPTPSALLGGHISCQSSRTDLPLLGTCAYPLSVTGPRGSPGFHGPHCHLTSPRLCGTPVSVYDGICSRLFPGIELWKGAYWVNLDRCHQVATPDSVPRARPHAQGYACGLSLAGHHRAGHLCQKPSCRPRWPSFRFRNGGEGRQGANTCGQNSMHRS